MRDGFDTPEETAAHEPRRARLTYPFEVAPESGSGQAVEVAPGVLWLRQPLGGSLGFINVWAIKDGDGWTIVDTGMATPQTKDGWRAAFADAMGGRPVTRVIVTHLHPDHIGLAGWMTRKFDCRLWMTRLEYFQCRMLVADTGREAPQDGVRFYQAAGWDEAAIEHYQVKFGGFGRAIHALPDSYRRMVDGETFEIGGRSWTVVVGSGHSPEHACLWQPDLKLLISGDQVLPKISSNVSVFPTEPQADPMNDWLTSLARLKTIVPEDVLVLPAHNDPFHGLHSRIDHLIAGHERALTRLEKNLGEAPRRAIDVFSLLFARVIGPDVLGMATGEAVAHLNCLVHRGSVTAEPDDHGVLWYRAA